MAGTLIILPCHAIYKGAGISPAEGDAWFLEPFQRGEHVVFLQHLRTALDQLKANHHSVLAISGGMTKSTAPGRSEARSYLEAAEILGW